MAEETKKTTSTKKTTTKKKTNTAKKTSSTPAKKGTTQNKSKASVTKKKNTSQPSKTKPKTLKTDQEKTVKKATVPKKPNSISKTKPISKSLKNDEKPSILTSKEVKTQKKPKKAKQQGRVKKEDELTTLEVLEQKIEHKDIIEKKPLGKTFYLLFALVFYAAAFFYINNIMYNNGDILQSAIFAFAALFIVFVLMLFNVHRLISAFFILPFRRLFKQASREAHKEIMFSVGRTKMQTTWNKYQSIFTLVIYTVIAGVLIYSSITGSLEQGDKILSLITNAVITLLIFVVIICSWQYLFNIIPSILDKSIDAKNGYILTLSAAVMVIYVVFLILEVQYLAEIMIFLLIIGFVALLGVNMNMIVGEINIFSNLRGRKSKAVTRVVFTVFFGFHIYIILYASVVAYSIYNWEPNSFVFSSYEYEHQIITDLEDQNGNSLDTVYWDDDNDNLTPVVPLTDIYWDHDSNPNTVMITRTQYYSDDYKPVQNIYDITGNPVQMTNENGMVVTNAVPVGYDVESCTPFYNDGAFACVEKVNELHTYGDFLYWTVVTVSTIGYGDVHPSTEYNIAMGWGAFLGMYGLTFFALSISFVSNIAMEGINTVREESRKHD